MIPAHKLCCTAALLATLPASLLAQPKPKDTTAIDYIYERLKRVEKVAVPGDRLGEVFDLLLHLQSQGALTSVWLENVTKPNPCTLRLAFSGVALNAAGGIISRVEAELKLKDAELGGTKPMGRKVIFRMLQPIDVSHETTFRKTDDSTPKALLEPSKYSKPQQEFAVPAYDEEEARRLSRALEQAIGLCGGKRDPFAK